MFEEFSGRKQLSDFKKKSLKLLVIFADPLGEDPDCNDLAGD
jgi:hypothetical protein